ncbi:hypothetical protein EKK58_11865 [Candidatus Dependentiae bacterium]|nr:MAG: hypothetical protein EKK58_11865 [Candidatus Dependentiae bacterium]
MNINFNTLSKGLSVVKTVAMNRRSEILLGTALTSSLLSTVLAGKAGYEARGRVVEYEHPSVDFKEPEAELTFKEKAMLTWDCYIPAGLTNLTTLGSVSALHAFHMKDKRDLALLAVSAVEKAKEGLEKEILPGQTQSSVVDGDKPVQVQDSNGVIEELYLVRDMRTNRDIWSNKQRIEAAVLEANKLLQETGDCDLNTFYSFAGYDLILPEGDDWGWSGSPIELAYPWESGIRDDGRPFVGFRFRPSPSEHNGRSY